MMRGRGLRVFSYFVLFYLVMALGWWSILLIKKNEDAFRAKAKYRELVMLGRGEVQSHEEYLASNTYRQLLKDYQWQRYMILGEGSLILLGFFFGLYLVSKSFRKEMQAARQQNNFLLSITHELKSPIASIKLVLETLLKRESLQREKVRQLSANAIKESDRLHNLVNELLLAARLDSTNQLNLTEGVLLDPLEEAIEKVKADHPDVNWEIRLPPTLPVTSFDHFAMKRVFLNLLENAIKYSPRNAQLSVQVRERKSGGIQIAFADQGFGIPEEERKRVFQKFYRIGNEDTRQTKGTGLGLYIVKQIVQAHGGKVHIKDNQPQGTVFLIHLPGKLGIQKKLQYETNLASRG